MSAAGGVSERERRNGGAYISAGTYGCVFSPPLKCTKTSIHPHKRTVGKVFSSKESASGEIADVETIKRFDPEYKFTVPYLGQCTVSSNKFLPTDEVGKCRKHITAEPKIYKQLLFEHGGYDLTMLFTNPGTIDIAFDDFLAACIPVLEGIQRMQVAGYVHADIKPQNMLLDESRTALRVNLIDFGLMGPLNEIKSRFWSHRHEYPYYPPEFRIFDAMRHGVKDEEELLKVCWNNLRSLGQRWPSWMNTYWPRKAYESEMRAAVKNFMKMPLRTFYDEFDEFISPKVDVYGMGVALLEIIYENEMRNALKVKSQPLFKKAMRQVLLPMVHPNVYKRISIEEAIAKMKGLFGEIVPLIEPAHLTKEECIAKSVKELRVLLASYGLPVSGTKAIMCARLQKAHTLAAAPTGDLKDKKDSKDSKDCNKSEAKGGYSITELRAMAKKLGLAHQKKRKEICHELELEATKLPKAASR